MTATLRKQDVKDDIAAALSLCLALDLEILGGHCCPYTERGVTGKAVAGLTRLLGRFDTGTADQNGKR